MNGWVLNFLLFVMLIVYLASRTKREYDENNTQVLGASKGRPPRQEILQEDIEEGQKNLRIGCLVWAAGLGMLVYLSAVYHWFG